MTYQTKGAKDETITKRDERKRAVMPWRAVSANVHIMLDLFLPISLNLSCSDSVSTVVYQHDKYFSWGYEVHLKGLYKVSLSIVNLNQTLNNFLTKRTITYILFSLNKIM